MLGTAYLYVGYGLKCSGILLGYGKSYREQHRYQLCVPGTNLEAPCKVPAPGILCVQVHQGFRSTYAS